jgi:hypothetical protein
LGWSDAFLELLQDIEDGVFELVVEVSIVGKPIIRCCLAPGRAIAFKKVFQ